MPSPSPLAKAHSCSNTPHTPAVLTYDSHMHKIILIRMRPPVESKIRSYCREIHDFRVTPAALSVLTVSLSAACRALFVHSGDKSGAFTSLIVSMASLSSLMSRLPTINCSPLTLFIKHPISMTDTTHLVSVNSTWLGVGLGVLALVEIVAPVLVCRATKSERT